VVAVDTEAGPVPVRRGAASGADAVEGRLDALGDGGADPVRAHDEARVRAKRSPVPGPADDTGDGAGRVPFDVGDGNPEARLRPGIGCRVDQDRVENGTARRIQRLDAVGRLDRDRHDLARVAERDPSHGRSPGRDDPVQEPPTVQLQHAAPHQRVGRQRVGAVLPPVEQQHAQPGPGQQERGGSAGRSGADHRDVVPHPASTSIDTGTPWVSMS
jgi:hypothetical protein